MNEGDSYFESFVNLYPVWIGPAEPYNHRTGEIASLRLIKVERNPLDFGIADLSEPVHSSGFALRNRIFKCNVFAQIT